MPESKSGYAIQSSVGIAIDFDNWKLEIYKSTGSANPCGDVVKGIGLGIGPIIGNFKGSMEDFMGLARERTEYYGPISKTDIEVPSGKTGISASAGGKGLGFGFSSFDTYTSPLFSR